MNAARSPNVPNQQHVLAHRYIGEMVVYKDCLIAIHVSLVGAAFFFQIMYRFFSIPHTVGPRKTSTGQGADLGITRPEAKPPAPKPSASKSKQVGPKASAPERTWSQRRRSKKRYEVVVASGGPNIEYNLRTPLTR